jgi:hypothetical protein
MPWRHARRGLDRANVGNRMDGFDLFDLGLSRFDPAEPVASLRDRASYRGESLGALGMSRRRAMREEAGILDDGDPTAGAHRVAWYLTASGAAVPRREEDA